MGVKLLSLLVVAAAVLQGHCLTEIFLDDEHITYLGNDLIGRAITIPKSWFDTLEACYVILPDGIMYEAYPNNELPNFLTFLEAVQPFTACGVAFRGVGVEYSGTYELFSMVKHGSDLSLSLTRQKFHLEIREI